MPVNLITYAKGWPHIKYFSVENRRKAVKGMTSKLSKSKRGDVEKSKRGDVETE